MITEAEVKSLQDIVGSRWVSTDPCMMDTYAFYMNPEVLNREGGRFLPRPEAVVLPESTKEVQEIVRFCNKSGLMTKALSTGFHTAAAVSRERVILLDLKRMDKIIDIDYKNQIAVVEPYVKAINLQTILMKQGLNVHVVSCGGNHSLLASVAAAWGYGLTGSSMGYSGRTLMGLEWVLPTGEILTLGSAGADANAGWFSADGPGPSLRGIVRGFQGTFGCLGIFTKCAIKLYKWDGPPDYEVGGCSPCYLLKKIPPKMSVNVLAFPSGQAMRNAGYKLGEAELDYSEFRTPLFFTALGLTADNIELKAFLDSGIFHKIARYVLINAVVGYSEREYKWKMNALRQILREEGGVMLPMNFKPTAAQLKFLAPIMKAVDDPLAVLRLLPTLQTIIHKTPINKAQALEAFSRLFWLLIRHANNTQATFRPSQGMFTTLGSFDTWDLGVTQSDWIAEAKRPVIKAGLILDDDGDCGCGGTFESGHMGYLEGIGLYDAKNPKSVIAAGDLVEAGVEACIEKAFGIPIAGFGEVMNSRFGPHCGNYHIWMRKIKKALDPNTAADPFFYAEPYQGQD